MKYFKYIVTFLFVICLSLSVVLANDAAKLVIGVSVPLTGTSSFVGEAIKNSILLANDELPEKDRFKIIVDDDGFKPANTLSIVQKFINEDKVDFIFVLGTNQGMAVRDVIAKAGIPFLSLNVNRSVVENMKQSFLVAPALEDLTALNIKVAKEKSYKKVAVVSTIQDSCLLQKKIFEDSGEFEITNSFEINPDDLSVRDIAVKIKASRPDAVFLSTFPPQGGVLARRLREVGYAGHFFGGIQQYRREEIKNSNGALIGAWFASGSEENARPFITAYQNKYGVDPRELSMFSLYAYDGFGLLSKAVQSGDVLNYFRTVKDFQGISGKLSANGKNGFTFPVAARELKVN
jgi:branched-chain amino acid transport system substrate-binding protein